ncbi:MAG: DUF192 domain-containing protein [Bryobacteraceae bacterium]|nr:DUF192 domain-containing protein [Bryobacteraceae bacterium]
MLRTAPLAPVVLLVLLLLGACGADPALAPGERLVKLPGGRKIVAEVAMTPEAMQRGMMYRDSLAPDRGMLFLHAESGRHPYWMHNCKIALDIIWLDSAKRVVEISAATPPCQKEASECPSYGGTQPSQFVLELASGMAAQYGLSPGVAIEF